MKIWKLFKKYKSEEEIQIKKFHFRETYSLLSSRKLGSFSWSDSSDASEGLLGVAADWDGSGLLHSLVNELSTGRLDDLATVRGGVVSQSTSISQSLDHCDRFDGSEDDISIFIVKK